MPADRIKKTRTPKEVPSPGDPDRKRVLNVLAQRRYRERQRAKIAALEAQLQESNAPESLAEPHASPTFFPAGGDAGLLSGPLPDETVLVEEIIRDPLEIGFPPMDFDQDALGMQLMEDYNLHTLSTPRPLTPISLDDANSPEYDTSTTSQSLVFPLSPDGAKISLPILSTIHAFTTIATCLDVISKIWDPGYRHTLAPIAPTHLPPNLHPTPTQMTVPHHPFLDALPWPSVRDNLICIFNLPPASRPPVAQGDDGKGEGIMKLWQDLDDSHEGVRVHGNFVEWGAGSELSEEVWEIGELFYRNWWWCIDARIVGTANAKRRERGLPPLR